MLYHIPPLDYGTREHKTPIFIIKITVVCLSVCSGGRCPEDEMNMLVPIVVGACLAGLIVIVLVAYFIGRYQSKRGYENV